MRLAGHELRDDLGDAARLVVAMEADEPTGADPVAVEEDLRTARVLAEHRVRVAKRREHAKRDVLEIADRRRADDERHRQRSPSSASNPTSPAPTRPGVVTELGGNDPERLVRGLERFAPRRYERGLAKEIPGGDAEPSADDDQLRSEDVRRASRSRCRGSDRCGRSPHARRRHLRERPRRARRASTPSPQSSIAARSAASPEATASRWPRPWQLPWHGGPSARTTT